MENKSTWTRRSTLKVLAGTTAAALGGRQVRAEESSSAATADSPRRLKGRLKQSVCKWCYRSLSLEDLCQEAVRLGIPAIDLLGPEDWPTVKKYGLICSMPNGPGSIVKGWNRLSHHDELVAKSEELLPRIAEMGFPNMIVFSGNREGLDDLEGIRNCAKGLKRITPLAEELGVTLCMELLNSKRDHKDYQCDHTQWGVHLVNEVGSERFKLLYDIYHMQIMEGDVIATIRENIESIAHFHTGGVPGRGEIDETQELNYRRICEAIVETGFDGYLAQEFIPRRNPIESLAQAVRICDV